MRERINQLAKGIIDTEVPLITLVPSSIEEIISPGEQTEGRFKVDSHNDLPIRGLVYSSNTRVKIKNSAFGGLRNEIIYEVNSNYLEHEDEIKGSFYLVANSGEQEIPYSFRIKAEKSEQTLRQLNTPDEYAELAKRDLDTAIRLFDYTDFVQAPFMQDLNIRTLYDGLKNHGSRYHQLEEFLVALKVKEPVKVTVKDRIKNYQRSADPIKDCIVLEKSTWGYVTIQIETDGDFIQLSTGAVQDAGFQDDEYRIPYKISPAKLHSGKNFGRIRLTVNEEEIEIKIQVIGNDDSLYLEEDDHFKKDYLKYLKLRLEYESRYPDRKSILSQMLVQIEKMRLSDQESPLLALCQAEIYLLKGSIEKAIPILEDYRQAVMKVRHDQKDLYCFYQYLLLTAVPDEVQKEAFVRLVTRYLETKQIRGTAALLAFTFDEDYLETPEYTLIQLKKMFKQKCSSPFLYLEACKLWTRNPKLLQEIGSFELQAIYCGVKQHMISEELGRSIALLFVSAKRLHPLFYKILMMLYDQYPQKEILTGICSLLIRKNSHEKKDFIWYEKALREEIAITRLYEYFLYSLPDNYEKLIPKEVLLYFSYDHNLDVQGKSVLYHNILMYMDQEDPLYSQYEREIGKFATEQLLNIRMNSRLAVIYDRMIYRDMVDLQMAKVLPAMLKANRLVCSNKMMKSVIVCYQELMTEESYPLKEGVAYVPLFSSKCVILFQDAYGNRYSNAAYTKNRILVKPELESRCFELCPTHPMLLLQLCKEVSKKDKLDKNEVKILERAITELEIHPFYEHQIQLKILDFYKEQLSDEKNTSESSYLLRINHRKLPRNERNLVCECLIINHYIREAYQMLQEYGWEEIDETQLLQLADKMILQQLFDQDEWLLQLSDYLFQKGYYDRVILDYLSEYFNGSSKQMFRILRQSLIDHVETYDLEERLLGQMLFVNHQDRIDQVFDWYIAKKNINERIIKAFFTMKCAEYVLDNLPAKDRVFIYLESTIEKLMQQDKIPTLYLLALTKYYSTLPLLTEEQSGLCQEMMYHLMGQGIVLSYMKNLAAHISVSEDIMNKGIIQYHGKKNSQLELRIRILPEEEEYHTVSMRRMYQGIFVKQIVLFEGEIAEYQIYEQKEKGAELVFEGSVSCQLSDSAQSKSRFTQLNQMGLCLTVKEDAKLKQAMQDYLIKNTAVDHLFEFM